MVCWQGRCGCRRCTCEQQEEEGWVASGAAMFSRAWTMTAEVQQLIQVRDRDALWLAEALQLWLQESMCFTVCIMRCHAACCAGAA